MTQQQFSKEKVSERVLVGLTEGLLFDFAG